MTQRSQKRLLWAVNLAMLAGLACSVAWEMAPLEQASPPKAAGPRRVAPAAARPRVGPLEDYAVIYRQDLRRPLVDAPLVPTQPVAPPPIHLTGTAVDADSSVAFFRTSKGEARMASVGDTVEGVEVVEIKADLAKVKFNGQTFTMRKEVTPP